MTRWVMAGATDKGPRRVINEDLFYINETCGLALVVDGASGLTDGRFAARLTAAVVRSYLDSTADASLESLLATPDAAREEPSHLPRVPEAVLLAGSEAARRLRRAIYAADLFLRVLPDPSSPSGDIDPAVLAHLDDESRRQLTWRLKDARANPPEPDRTWFTERSTVAVLVANGDRAVVANVGDSRIYRLRGSLLEQLSTDHSLSEALRQAGHALPPERAARYAKILVLTIGGGAEPGLIALREEPLRPGDLFLLCSDGVTDVFENLELRALLDRPGETVESLVAALMERTLERRPDDNVTVVLARWE